MAPRSHACRSPCVNSLTNLIEQNKPTDQGLARRFNVESNKASTKAHTPLEAPIPTLVPPSTKDLFIKFMKVFVETT